MTIIGKVRSENHKNERIYSFTNIGFSFHFSMIIVIYIWNISLVEEFPRRKTVVRKLETLKLLPYYVKQFAILLNNRQLNLLNKILLFKM